MEVIIERLHNAFSLSFDLMNSLTSQHLNLKLEGLPSNTIGEQFWCMIGARESYLNAMINEGWVGFSCSLNDTKSKEKVSSCMQTSANDTLSFLSNKELSKTQMSFLFLLLEHEIQHHGQLIRYIYANKLTFPESWNKRYSV